MRQVSFVSWLTQLHALSVDAYVASRVSRVAGGPTRYTARILSAPLRAYSTRNCANRNERSPVMNRFSWAAEQTLKKKKNQTAPALSRAKNRRSKAAITLPIRHTKKKKKKKHVFKHRFKHVSASYDVVLSHWSYPRTRRRRLRGYLCRRVCNEQRVFVLQLLRAGKKECPRKHSAEID